MQWSGRWISSWVSHWLGGPITASIITQTQIQIRAEIRNFWLAVSFASILQSKLWVYSNRQVLKCGHLLRIYFFKEKKKSVS